METIESWLGSLTGVEAAAVLGVFILFVDFFFCAGISIFFDWSGSHDLSPISQAEFRALRTQLRRTFARNARIYSAVTMPSGVLLAPLGTFLLPGPVLVADMSFALLVMLCYALFLLTPPVLGLYLLESRRLAKRARSA